MGELILHIGTIKTGTTSLQHYLLLNREVLLRQGVDYIQFTPQEGPLSPGARNGIFLSRYCLALTWQKEFKDTISDFEENYNRLAAALKGSSRVLISDENFSNYATKRWDEQYNPESYWREMARIIKELGASKTTIIVYLRRQDEYVISSWKERVRGGWTDQPFRDYLKHEDRKYELNYNILLDAIHNSFSPSANLIVRSYNQATSSGTDIFHDFCEALGIAWDSDFRIPKTRLNPSISFDMAEALLTCKLGGAGRSTEEKMVRKSLAINLCRNHPDPKGTTFLVPGEAEALKEQYCNANHGIGPVYYDNEILWPDEFESGDVWHPNRRRIAWYRFVVTLMSLCPPLSVRIWWGLKRVRHSVKLLMNKGEPF